MIGLKKLKTLVEYHHVCNKQIIEPLLQVYSLVLYLLYDTQLALRDYTDSTVYVQLTEQYICH